MPRITNPDIDWPTDDLEFGTLEWELAFAQQRVRDDYKLQGNWLLDPVIHAYCGNRDIALTARWLGVPVKRVTKVLRDCGFTVADGKLVNDSFGNTQQSLLPLR